MTALLVLPFILPIVIFHSSRQPTLSAASATCENKKCWCKRTIKVRFSWNPGKGLFWAQRSIPDKLRHSSTLDLSRVTDGEFRKLTQIYSLVVFPLSDGVWLPLHDKQIWRQASSIFNKFLLKWIFVVFSSFTCFNLNHDCLSGNISVLCTMRLKFVWCCSAVGTIWTFAINEFVKRSFKWKQMFLSIIK